MRQLIGILLFVSSTLFAGAQGFHLAPTALSNSISPAYAYVGANGTSLPNVLMTLINPMVKTMFVSNSCTQPLAFTFTNTNATTIPSSNTTTNPLQIFVGAGTTSTPAYGSFYLLGAGKYVWVRTDNASLTPCTAGDIIVDFY